MRNEIGELEDKMKTLTGMMRLVYDNPELINKLKNEKS